MVKFLLCRSYHLRIPQLRWRKEKVIWIQIQSDIHGQNQGKNAMSFLSQTVIW